MTDIIPTDTRRSPNVALMWYHRLRRRSDSKTTLYQYVVFVALASAASAGLWLARGATQRLAGYYSILRRRDARHALLYIIPNMGRNMERVDP